MSFLVMLLSLWNDGQPRVGVSHLALMSASNWLCNLEQVVRLVSSPAKWESGWPVAKVPSSSDNGGF